MKKYITILSICLLGLISQELFGQENELSIPLTYPSQAGHLNIHVFSGTITIKGSSRRDISVRYEALKKSEQEITNMGNGLKKISSSGIKLDVQERDNKVRIKSDATSSPVKVIVEMPYDFDLMVSTHYHGNIDISNITGDLEIKAHYGHIEANGISGSIVANTWNGHIIATFDELTKDAPLAFTTYYGKVDISLPSNARFDLKARSDKGEVLTGFDIRLEKNKPVIRETTKNGTNKITLIDWVQGRINGGGPELLAKTHQADIFIRKRNRF